MTAPPRAPSSSEPVIPVVIVHGGAGLVRTARERTEHAGAVRAALRCGLAAVDRGGAAAAVVAAVASMEEAPVLNAGRGATLDAAGHATLDAGFMEGRDLRFGAVGCVTRTVTPVVLARALSEQGEFGCFIVGRYADDLVDRYGIERCEPGELVSPQALRAWQRRARRVPAPRAADTVGAVALDREGRVAAAVSTGGLAGKPRGRVGDSAVAGAGFWAEEPLGACVTTGIGEAMLREGTARRSVRLLAEGVAPEHAAAEALAEASRLAADGAAAVTPCGLILVTCDGRFAIAHTSPAMIAAYASPGGRAVVRSRW
jgi:beta-aspartyl-peptidase (threonine type)